MYRSYSLAALCYAYLHDVPEEYAFDGSQWHWRGWTLQEFIAPRVVVFLSASWMVLGTKADSLAEQLTRCTRVPADVLRCEKPPAAVSIAQRMSWAAGRRTTRVEDEAYCLWASSTSTCRHCTEGVSAAAGGDHENIVRYDALRLVVAR